MTNGHPGCRRFRRRCRSSLAGRKDCKQNGPFPQDHPIEEFLQSVVKLTHEQKMALTEAEERLEQRQREWEAIVQALQDNSMAVFRAMRRLRHESEPEQVERVLTSFEDGRFLIDRMGAESTVDPDLAVVLLDLRRRLRDEYGTGPTAIMLIDRAVSAYQDFVRVTGWIGNLSIHIEREFFGRDAPKAEFQGRTIRGLTVEQHLAHVREGLLPLTERCGRAMRDALSALECLRAGPIEAVERSRPFRIALKL